MPSTLTFQLLPGCMCLHQCSMTWGVSWLRNRFVNTSLSMSMGTVSWGRGGTEETCYHSCQESTEKESLQQLQFTCESICQHQCYTLISTDARRGAGEQADYLPPTVTPGFSPWSFLHLSLHRLQQIRLLSVGVTAHASADCVLNDTRKQTHASQLSMHVHICTSAAHARQVHDRWCTCASCWLWAHVVMEQWEVTECTGWWLQSITTVLYLWPSEHATLPAVVLLVLQCCRGPAKSQPTAAAGRGRVRWRGDFWLQDTGSLSSNTIFKPCCQVGCPSGGARD